jgi:hypothetical protein
LKLLDQSLAAWLQGDIKLSQRILRQAFREEGRLAERETLQRERSIRYACAAFLAIRCGELEKAEDTLDIALSNDPHPEAVDELQRLYIEVNIRSQVVIGVTGNTPHAEQDLKKGILLNGGYIGDKEIWQRDQILVIGREDFDKDYLRASVGTGLLYGFTCRYMRQEDFVYYASTGTLPKYYRDDPRIRDHAGLRFLTSIGFKWPSTDATVGIGGTSDTDYNTESELTKYGYNVKQGTPEQVRRAALARAVAGMGLYGVVDWIAKLVRWRKAKLSDNSGPIGRWEADLQWLHDKYYKGSKHSFIWPEY